MPQLGAEVVASVDQLLSSERAASSSSDTRAGDWLVVLPEGTSPFVFTYIGYQLAHTQYPLRVDVALVDSISKLETYHGVVVAPGIMPDESWRATGEHGGFTRFVRSDP
jgi:hypothetical protein